MNIQDISCDRSQILFRQSILFLVNQCQSSLDRTGQDRTGQDRTGQDRTGQDRIGQDKTHTRITEKNKGLL